MTKTLERKLALLHLVNNDKKVNKDEGFSTFPCHANMSKQVSKLKKKSSKLIYKNKHNKF